MPANDRWDLIRRLKVKVAQDRVKVRIFSEPVFFATRITFKCKRGPRESVCKDGMCMELAQDLVR